jgi:hypothetical protein
MTSVVWSTGQTIGPLRFTMREGSLALFVTASLALCGALG